MRKTISTVLVVVLAFGSLGCATNYHGVEISNISAGNIREIYIKNAGTANWGPNMVRNLQNIDKSIFSETVDIRVVDVNGIVYSKYNVPFGDAEFVQTNQTSSPNTFAMGILALAILIPLLIMEGE